MMENTATAQGHTCITAGCRETQDWYAQAQSGRHHWTPTPYQSICTGHMDIHIYQERTARPRCARADIQKPQACKDSTITAIIKSSV